MTEQGRQTIQAVSKHMAKVLDGLRSLTEEERCALLGAMLCSVARNERRDVHLGVLEFVGQAMVAGARALDGGAMPLPRQAARGVCRVDGKPDWSFES